MIKIAEMLPPDMTATPLWTLMEQPGTHYAVGSIYSIQTLYAGEEAPWEYIPLSRLKQQHKLSGFELAVIEARPPLNLTKRGLSGRDAEIDAVLEMLHNMSRLGIRTSFYEWMADFNWIRTSTAIRSRGGSLVTGYDHALLSETPPSRFGPVSEETLWESLDYFLRRVVPVAERYEVQLAMHPDDPPISPIRGISRIMSSVESYQRLLDLVPSSVNGINLYQGTFSLTTEDLPTTIRDSGRQGKIFFIHARDVRGDAGSFEETWHDDGRTDLVECMRAYREADYDGVLRPDNVPTVVTEANEIPGYAILDRLLAVGYIRRLRSVVYHYELTAARDQVVAR